MDHFVELKSNHIFFLTLLGLVTINYKYTKDKKNYDCGGKTLCCCGHWSLDLLTITCLGLNAAG